MLEETAARLRTARNDTLRALAHQIDPLVGRLLQVIRRDGEDASAPRVGDRMQEAVHTCTPEQALVEPARILWEHDCGCVPVVAGDGSGRVVGMVTDRDLCMAAFTSGARLGELRVEQAMSGAVCACRPTDSLADAAALMRSAQVRRLPVVDGEGRLRGLLSLADLAVAADPEATPDALGPAEVGAILAAICRPRASDA